jgi:hypothetical protein
MIVERLEGIQGSSPENKEADDLHTPPPQAGHEEVDLPPLTKSGQDNYQHKFFPSEIPDSEAVSDWSLVDDGGNHGNAATVGVESSKAKQVQEQAAHAQSPSNKIVAEKPDDKPTHPGEDANLVNNTPFEDNESSIEVNSAPVASATALSNILYGETSQDILIALKSSSRAPGTSNIAEANALTLGDSTNGSFPAENPLVEVDTLSIDANTVRLCKSSFSEGKDNVTSKMINSSMTKPVEEVQNLLPSKPVDASQEPQASSSGKGTSLLSTITSSQIKRDEGDICQTNDLNVPCTPFKRPDASQNKDAMMIELKAMKIVSHALWYLSSLLS